MAKTGNGGGPKQPSERTYGQRHTKGVALYDLVKGDAAYNPKGNDLITAAALKTHLDKVLTGNKQVADLTPAYDNAQDKRVEQYYGPEGIIKRSALVREVIGGLKGGKGSTAYLTVQRLAQEMHNYRKPKKEVADGTDPGPQRSTAQMSFGSLLQKGREVLGVIKEMGDQYVTDNALVTVAAFEQLLNDAEAQDTKVNEALKPLNAAKRDRKKLVEDPEEGLTVRIAAMKSYVAGNVEGGKKSVLYQELVKVRYQ